ncbi:MAG: AMP-binding protein [archaeon]
MVEVEAARDEREIIAQFNILLKNFSGFNNLGEVREIRKIEDIDRIPMTTRQSLESLGIKNAPIQPLCMHVTSGSSGKNVPVFYSEKSWQVLVERTKKLFEFMEISKKDIVLNLFEYGLSNEGLAIDNALASAGIAAFPCGNLEKEKKYLARDLIKKIKPTALISFPSFIFDLIELNADLSSIKKIMHAGSFVSREFFDFMRSRIDAVFYNCYGCNEVGPISISRTFEDEFSLLIDKGLYIEVLDDNSKPHEIGEGRILITDLYNLSTPMIRYFLGDRVKIIKQDGKKYIKVLKREDSYSKINGAVMPVGLLVKTCMEQIGHDHFSILVNFSKSSMKDETVIYLLKKDAGKASALQKEFNEKLNLFPQIKLIGNMPRTFTGKIRNFIDARKPE